MLHAFWGSTTTVVIVAGLGSSAYVAAEALAGRGPGLLRWTACVSLFAWLLTVLFHGLASIHAFTPPTAALGAATLGVLALRGRWESTLRLIQRDRRHLLRLRVRLRHSPYRGAVFAIALCSVPIVLRTLVLPPLGWDALTYHAVKAALWVQHGAIDGMNGPGTWAYYRNMLGGGEVFTAWAMLPFHADTLVPAIDLAGWLGAGVGTWLLARELGAREPYASTGAAFVLSVPALRLMPGSVYVEPVMLATFTAGLALAAAAVTRRRVELMLPAAAALGVSAATKYSMLLATALPLVVAALCLHGRGLQRRRWTVAATVAYVLPVGPWLLRTWLDTGAPLSPVPIALAGWTLGVAPPEVLWYMGMPARVPVQAASELDVLTRLFPLPQSGVEGLGALTAVVAPLMLAGVPGLARRSPRACAVVIAALTSCLATYYAPSFAMIRHVFPVNSSRFLLPVVLAGTALGVSWCRRGSGAADAVRRFLLGATLWHLFSYMWVGSTTLSRGGALRAGLIALALAEAWWLLGLLRLGPIRYATRALAVVAALALLFPWRDAHRYDLWEADYSLHPFGAAQYWPGAAAELDTPDRPRRIAVTAGPDQRLDNWFVYPFMGRRLQNEVMYVPLSSDGRVHHFGGPAENARYAEVADYDIWKARLQLLGVTDVVSFLPTSTELTWMEHHPEQFQRVTGIAANWGVFHIAGR